MEKNIFFIIILILLSSCKTQENNKGISYNETADGWLNRPIDKEFYYSKPFDSLIEFIEIDKKNEAIILLNDVFYKKLTDEEYMYFTGKIKNEISNAYLIRSVNYAFNENGYRIYKSDKNNLLISHSVLSSSKRKGVHIFLYFYFATL
ncbi:hypothetical protein FACS1894147_12580 [Spirochaetia bacterium]|nr:hypothetical protein FACS1894147_12580 [Spirochaetia bacterium]